MGKNIDRDVLDGFIEEARSYLPTILEGIDAFRRKPEDVLLLEEAHRLAHSIKGAASMVGLAALSHTSYFIEEALEAVVEGELTMDRRAVDTFTQAVSQVEAYLDSLVEGKSEDRQHLAKLVGMFRRLRDLPEEGDQAEVERLLAGAALQPAAAPSTATTPQSAAALEEEETSPELVEAFLEEADDHLQAIAGGLRELEESPGDDGPERGLLQQVRRSVHTLKGAAAMVGFAAVGQLAHRMEDLLDRLFAGSVEATSEALELLHATADVFEDLLRGEGDGAALTRELYGRYEEVLGEELSPPEMAALAPPLRPLGEEKLIDLAELRSAGGDGAARAAAGPRVQAALRPSQVVRVPIDRLDELVRLVSELVVSRSTFEQYFGHLRREAGELGLSLDRLRRISGRLETDYEVATLARGSHLAAASPVAAAAGTAVQALEPPVIPLRPLVTGAAVREFDELELDRYTEFHLLTRELTETSSDISTVNGEMVTTIGDFDGYLNRIERLTSEVQDKLMRLRMVPLAQLSTRLHRTVRVTAQQQGKRVELALEGEEVELDKTVLEEIADPLLHLMRNAVDHGIEPPALRQAMGKAERGQIRLRAYHEGTQVVLQVADDGAGIEPSMIRTAAVTGGFLSEAEAAEMPEEDLHELLFLPGFSTAGEVSEVSGRGVGLDVVKATVVRNEGSLTVESSPGEGTTFTIRLPMTLAVTRVLMVGAADQLFAIPLGVVRQILRLDRQEVERVGSEPVIRVAGEAYPLVRLADSLSLPEISDEVAASRVPVLVVDLGERRYALAVDRLVEAREVVVKTLGTHLRRVKGITGATLTGDGSVVLILNPGELITADGRGRGEGLSLQAARRRAQRPLEVLIVDDSLSVRRVLSNLVRNAGWTPIAARDGVEALEMIQRSPRTPDVILLDIEMPRMDGYELTASLKGQEPYRQIPIVMITSRAGDKHRRKALDMGVADYLVKPYQDEVLINIVRRVTRQAGEARPR